MHDAETVTVAAIVVVQQRGRIICYHTLGSQPVILNCFWTFNAMDGRGVPANSVHVLCLVSITTIATEVHLQSLSVAETACVIPGWNSWPSLRIIP